MLLVNAMAFGLLAFVWKREDWYNALIKLAMVSLWLANSFFWLQQAGYIVKAG